MKLYINSIFFVSCLYLCYNIYLNISLYNYYLGEALWYLFCVVFLTAFYNGLKQELKNKCIII